MVLLKLHAEVSVAAVGLPRLEYALVVGMERSYMYQAPFGSSSAFVRLLRRVILFSLGLVVVGVVLGAIRLAVSKFPADITLEVFLSLHGDTASCNRWCV